jgi:hypothetical protein
MDDDACAGTLPAAQASVMRLSDRALYYVVIGLIWAALLTAGKTL